MVETLSLLGTLFASLFGGDALNIIARAQTQVGQTYATPILPPIAPGERPVCADPPQCQEILQVLRGCQRQVPFIYSESCEDLEFVVEKLLDRIDPPHFFPLIGQAQLHHCHWKCTVHFTEVIELAYPFPFRVKRPRTELVYIDKDCLHLAEQMNPQRVRE